MGTFGGSGPGGGLSWVLGFGPRPGLITSSDTSSLRVAGVAFSPFGAEGLPGKIVTWLILPVVICLSQRLSHACLSISNLYGETANGSLNQLSFI